MKSFKSEGGNARKDNQRLWLWRIVIAGAVLMMLVAWLWPRSKGGARDAESAEAAGAGGHSGAAAGPSKAVQRFGNVGSRRVAKSAEQVVAEKMVLFGQKRRELEEKIARRLGKDGLPPEIDAFFKAIDAGDWNEIQRLEKELRAHQTNRDRPDLDAYWPGVMDTFGVAQQTHEWPAQKLLDYGNAILDSLKPGMVYVGGTDCGRFVPELLSETSEDPHVVITQNALADPSYMNLLSDLYGEDFKVLSPEDSQKAFQDYIADAQKRFQHDLDFPNEPKQMLPSENVTMVDGHLQVSGATAVMGINEKMLQMLMAQNPELSFGLEESFPLRGTYANALPDGPLMELNAQSEQTPFSAALATQSVDYWRSTAQTLLADPEAAGSTYALTAYSHDINATANLLASHNFTAQAEDAYSLASQMWPGNPEPVNGLAQLLAQSGHADQARQLLDQFAAKYPEQQGAIAQARAVVLGSARAH